MGHARISGIAKNNFDRGDRGLGPLAPAAHVGDTALAFCAALGFAREVLAEELAVRTARAHAMRARARFVRVASNARGIHLEDSPAHNLAHGIAIAGEAAVVDVNGVMSNVVTGDKNKVPTSIDVGDDNVARFKLLRDVADAECGGIAKGPAP